MSRTRQPTVAELVELVATHAEKLRSSGVTRLRVGEMECEFSPTLPQIQAIEPDEERAPQRVNALDALSDPSTFGGRIPSFIRPQRKAED